MLGLRTICEYALCAIVVMVVSVPTPPPVPLPDDPPEPLPPPTPLGTVVQRYSTHSFLTSETDTPPGLMISGRVTGGIVMGRRINPGPEGQFGGLIVASFGEIEVANTDGALDALADEYFIDGRVITVLAGQTEIDPNGREVVKPLTSFSRIYSATAGAWKIEHDTLRLTIRDAGITLQRQFQTAIYGGTGGQQGTPDMKGKTVPVALGQCENVTAQQIDPIFLTYQVHDGKVFSIPQVFDKGIQIPFDQDYPSYPTLVAATVPPGEHATCRQGGYFRLGTTPVGTVTADVEGDNTGSDYALSHAAVIRRILAKYSWLDQTLIDEASFAIYHNQLDDGVGMFLPAGDTSTIENVIERLTLSGGAIAGQDRSGLYRIQQLRPPTDNPLFAFTDKNMLFIERLLLPYGVPWRKWTVHGVRNWTVQLPSDLAGSVSQSRQRFLEVETRSETVNTPDVSSAHPSSADGVRQSHLRALDKCEDAAVRLAEFYSIRRALYRINAKGVLFRIELGQTVSVTYPRWNLANGRNFVVVAVSDDAATQETTLEVFG